LCRFFEVGNGVGLPVGDAPVCLRPTMEECTETSDGLPSASLPSYHAHALPQVIIEFLKTGRYRWWVPFVSSVRFTDPRAPKANDFVGLNYYRLVRAAVG